MTKGDEQPPDTHVLISTVTGALMCTLSLKPIFERLGERDTTALLALHTVTGSDHLGRFASISKLTCWKFLQPVSGEV